jgi:hypothetical protein
MRANRSFFHVAAGHRVGTIGSAGPIHRLDAQRVVLHRDRAFFPFNRVNYFPNSSRPTEMHMSQTGWERQSRAKLVFGVVLSRLEIAHLRRYSSGIGPKPFERQVKGMAAMVHRNAAATIAAFATPMGFPFRDAFCMRVSVDV